MRDQARPVDERHGTGAPLVYAVLKLAERWHLHPADVDPTHQRPGRARWFWWALETAEWEAELLGKPKDG